jgi:hypothetical protein
VRKNPRPFFSLFITFIQRLFCNPSILPFQVLLHLACEHF